MDQNKRQSYDHQICDDLSEVILQFLSNDDKLKFECVSTQFQRTIFEKVYSLDIQNLVHLELMLNKCSNIGGIRKINYSNADKHSFEERFLIINLIAINSNLLQRFESFSIQSYDFNDSVFDFNNFYPNTKAFEKLLETILTINNNLVELKIFDEFGLNKDHIKPFFGRLADKFPNLKSFGCLICVERDLNTDPNLITIFGPLKQLKQLDLRIDNKPYAETFSIRQLRGLTNITHLSIDLIRPNEQIILTDFAIILPNLKSLRIGKEIIVSNGKPTILSGLPALQTKDLKYYKNKSQH